ELGLLGEAVLHVGWSDAVLGVANAGLRGREHHASSVHAESDAAGGDRDLGAGVDDARQVDASAAEAREGDVDPAATVEVVRRHPSGRVDEVPLGGDNGEDLD